MAMIELALVLIYVCVLLIKSCDMSSVRTTGPEVDRLAKAMCSSYGFGDTATGKVVQIRLSGGQSPRVCMAPRRFSIFLLPRYAQASGTCLPSACSSYLPFRSSLGRRGFVSRPLFERVPTARCVKPSRVRS